MKKILFSAVLTAVLSFSASAQYTDGIIILNEGGAGGGNASISYLSAAGTVQNNIFGAANGGADLGDTGQSLTFHGNNAYIVLNISNKLVIVNNTTFVEVATIDEGLTNPRYVAFYGDNAYVTCWGDSGETDDDYLAVISLTSNTITTTIPLTEGVERIITVGNKLYVAHQGGFGFGNIISVINAETNTFITTITVGDVPNSIFEKEGSLYVLCGGKPSWSGAETGGKLIKINLADNTVTETIDFAADAHPNNLEVYGTDLYYTVDEFIFKKAITATTLPETSLFSIEPQGAYGIYGFDIVGDKLYVADAEDYVSQGAVYVYAVDGVFGQKYDVGVIPNSSYKAADAVAGTGDFDAKTIAVYPNPVKDILFLNTDKEATVKIIDVTGRVVADDLYTTSGINVSALPSGTYFAEITIENAKGVKQIVIQ